MSFFTDIINKGKEILGINEPKEIDIAVNAATKAAVNVATPEAVPAIDLALGAASRFQEAPTTTVNVSLPESNFGFGGSENVNIPSANITQPAPFVPAPVDFEIGEPIKEIDNIRTEANIKSIAEIEDTQGNSATQFIKEVAAGATVGGATTLNPLGVAIGAGAAAINFGINKLTGYGIDDVINPLNEQIDVLRDYSNKLTQEGQQEENYLKIVSGAGIQFVNDFVSAPIDYADKYFDIVNMDESKLIDSRIKLNEVASYDEIKRLEDEGQSERAMAMRQFRVDHETELNTASAIKAITSLASIPLGRVFGVSGVVGATTVGGMIPTIADLIDIGGVDFAKDLKALSLGGRKTISEAPGETFIDVSPDKIVYGSDEYKTLGVEEKFFVKQGFTNEQKNEWYSSGIFTANQKDIANVKDKVNKLEAEAVQEFGKFLNNITNADERIKAKNEIEEYVNAGSDFYADVLGEVYKGKSFDKAVRDLSAKFDVEGKETVSIDGEKVPIRAYLNAVAAQGWFDTAGSKWRELNNKLYDAGFDTALESLIKNESKFALNSALSAERNLIDGLGALAAEFGFNKVAGLGLSKLGDVTNAITGGMFKSLMSRTIGGVATKVDELLGPVVGKVLKRGFEEGVEELATNPYYNMIDASKSDKPLTTFDVLSSMAVDFGLGAGIGGLTGLPQGRDKNLDLISVSKEENNLNGGYVDSFFRTTVKSALDVVISKDVIDEAKGLSPTNIISTLGKEYLSNGGDMDKMTAEHFNEEGIRQRKLELIKTPGLFGPNTIEQQQLIIAEEIKSGDKQRIADAIATAQAPYTFMSQVPGGTKTRGEQLGLNENATIQEVMSQIKEKFPVTPKKVTNFLLADGIEGYKKIVNQTIPSSEIAFKDIKINNELQTLISNVNFTQGIRTNADSPSSWNIEGGKEFHSTLMSKPSTLNVATTQSFANSLARPDGKITTGGKTYFYKMSAPRNSVAGFAKDATTGEAIEGKGKSKNIIDFYLYESISDIKPQYFVQKGDMAYLPDSSTKILKGKLLESGLFNIVGLSKDTTLTFQDMNDNILFTRGMKDAIQVELPEGIDNQEGGIIAVGNKFKEITGIDDAKLSTIRQSVNLVVDGDKQLGNYFIIQLAKDFRNGNKDWVNMSQELFIKYISARLLQDPTSTNKFLKILGEDTKNKYDSIRKDWFQTKEERFYDPEFYVLLKEVIPDLTATSLRKAVAKSYDLASRNLVEEAVLDRIYKKINPNTEQKSKLANTIAGVWNFIQEGNKDVYLGTKEDLAKVFDKLLDIDVSSPDDIRQFVINEKVFVNSMATAQYAMQRYFFGRSMYSAEYAMEVAHITKAMREITNYDARKFTNRKEVGASSAYLDVPMDLFQSRVQNTISNGTMTIDNWKEEILNTFYINYKFQDTEFVSNFIDKAIYLESLNEGTSIDKFIDFASKLIIKEKSFDSTSLLEYRKLGKQKIDALSEKLQQLYLYPHIEQFYSLKGISFDGLTYNDKRKLIRMLKDNINEDVNVQVLGTDTNVEKVFKNIMRENLPLNYTTGDVIEDVSFIDYNREFLRRALGQDAPSKEELNIIGGLLQGVDEKIYNKVAYAIYKGELNKANNLMGGNSRKMLDGAIAKLELYRAQNYSKFYAENNIKLGLGILPNDALIVDKSDSSVRWFSQEKNRTSAGYEYSVKLPFKVFNIGDVIPNGFNPRTISNARFPKKGIVTPPFGTNFYSEGENLYITSNNEEVIKKALGKMYDAYNSSEDKPSGLKKLIDNEHETLNNKVASSIADNNNLPDMTNIYRDAYETNKSLSQGQEVIVVTELSDKPSEASKNPNNWKKMISFANDVFKTNWSFKDTEYDSMATWASTNLTEAQWIAMRSDGYINVSNRLNEFTKKSIGKQISIGYGEDFDGFAEALVEAGVNSSNNGNVLRAMTSIMSERNDYVSLRNIGDDIVSRGDNLGAVDVTSEEAKRLIRLGDTFSALNNKSKITRGALNNLGLRSGDKYFKYLSGLFFSQEIVQEDSSVNSIVDDLENFVKEKFSDNKNFLDGEIDETTGEIRTDFTTETAFSKSNRLFGTIESVRQATGVLGIYQEYLNGQEIIRDFKVGKHIMLTPMANYVKGGNLTAPSLTLASVATDTYIQNTANDNINNTIGVIDTLVNAKDYNSANAILSRLSTIDISLKSLSTNNYKLLLKEYSNKIKGYENFRFDFGDAIKYIDGQGNKKIFNRMMNIEYFLEDKDVFTENFVKDNNFHPSDKGTRIVGKDKGGKTMKLQTFIREGDVLKAVDKGDFALQFDTNALGKDITIGKLLGSKSEYKDNAKSIYEMSPGDVFDLSKHPKLKKIFDKHITLAKISERSYSKQSVSLQLPVLEYPKTGFFESYVNSLIDIALDYIKEPLNKLGKISLFENKEESFSLGLFKSADIQDINLAQYESQLRRLLNKASESEKLNNTLDKSLLGLVNKRVKAGKSNEYIISTIERSQTLGDRYAKKDILRHINYAKTASETKGLDAIVKLNSIYSMIVERMNKLSETSLVDRVNNRVLEQEDILNDGIIRTRQEEIAGRQKERGNIIKQLKTSGLDKSARTYLKQELNRLNADAIELGIGLKYNTLGGEEEIVQGNIFSKLLENGSTPYLIEGTPRRVVEAIRDYANDILSKQAREASGQIRVAGEEGFNADIKLKKLDKQLASVLIGAINNQGKGLSYASGNKINIVALEKESLKQISEDLKLELSRGEPIYQVDNKKPLKRFNNLPNLIKGLDKYINDLDITEC